MTNGNDLINVHVNQSEEFMQLGLTKREYFAAMAIASGKSAKDAVIEADELIKTLNGE